MTSAPGDQDWQAASDPRTPPAQLAELAARRHDLHAVIAANPAAYPGLRQWIASVGGQRPAPAAQAMPQRPYPAMPARRRGKATGWLVGCGCLTVIVVVAVVLLGGGALLWSDDAETDGSGAATSSAEESRDPAVAEQLALFDDEQERFYELYAQIEGNPVAPLVADLGGFLRLETYATQTYATVDSVGEAIAEARERVQELQDRITAAKSRRTNSSGTLSEEMVDAAGDGFIKIDWEAATACNDSDRPGWETSACVYPEDPLLIHLRDEDHYVTQRHLEMIVVHELAHVYQRADVARSERVIGEYQALLDEGMFQGEVESMADCFALTYFDEWTLVHGVELGYGYVCNDPERAAVRDWAADLGVAMPS